MFSHEKFRLLFYSAHCFSCTCTHSDILCAKSLQGLRKFVHPATDAQSGEPRFHSSSLIDQNVTEGASRTVTHNNGQGSG